MNAAMIGPDWGADVMRSTEQPLRMTQSVIHLDPLTRQRSKLMHLHSTLWRIVLCQDLLFYKRRSLDFLSHRVHWNTSNVDPLNIRAHHIKPQESSVRLIHRDSQIKMFHLANTVDTTVDLLISISTSEAETGLTSAAHRSESR